MALPPAYWGIPENLIYGEKHLIADLGLVLHWEQRCKIY